MDLTPNSLLNPSGPDNMPIGIKATYTSIAITKNDVPCIAFCEDGMVKVKICTHISPLPTKWVDNSPAIPTSYCSHSRLVNRNGIIFLAYIDDYKIKILRNNGSGIWEDITPVGLTDNVIELTFDFDRNPSNDNLYIAYIDFLKRIHVTIYQNATTIVPKLIGVTLQKGLSGKFANNISISTIDDVSYIAFSHFSPSFLSIPILPEGKTTVMTYKLSLQEGSQSGQWKPYGFWMDSSTQKGIASAAEAFSEGPTFYNCIAAASVNHVYLGYRGGLHKFGGGQLGRFFAKGPQPRWQGKPPDEPTGSEIPEPPLPLTILPREADFITSAFDNNKNFYLADSNNPRMEILKIFNGQIIDVLDPDVKGDSVHYLSLAFDSKNNLFFTYVDLFGYINVFMLD